MHASPRFCTAVLVLVASLVSGAAIGQTNADLERAEAAATEAKALFKNKLYVEAAPLFMKAYAISKRPPLVYNAARAYEEAGKLKRAESLFLMYRDLPGVDADGKMDVEMRLVALRKAIKAKAAAGHNARPGDGKPGDGKPAQESASSVPWLQVGVAGVGLAAAAGAYLYSRSIADGLDLADVNNDDDMAAYASDRDAAYLWRNVAIGAAVVGVGAGIWAALSFGDDPKRTTTWWISPAPDRVSLTVRF